MVLRLSSADRRKRHVELTARGRAVLQRGRRLWRIAQERFEKIFGKGPAAELRTVLLRIAGNEQLNHDGKPARAPQACGPIGADHVDR